MQSIKKCFLVSALVLCFGFGVYTPSAHAGIPVIDASNLIENILNFIQNLDTAINTYTQIDNQITAIENQVKSLYNQGQNLKNMNLANSLANLAQLRTTLSKIMGVMNAAKGLPLQYSAMDSQYNQLYKNLNGYTGGTPDQFKQQAIAVMQQTNDSIYDAMKTQGMIEDIQGDEEDLESLLDNSDNAQGALEAAQVSNQIAGVNTTQLMRLQTMMSASARQQASRDAEELQKKEMSMADDDRVMQNIRNMSDPALSAPQGDGFINFGGN